MTPEKMQLTDIDPELQGAFSKMPNLRLDRAWVRWLVRCVMRLQRKTPKHPQVEFSKQARGAADIRVYKPKSGGTGAGLLWIHGGGMIMGDASMNDADCLRYAAELGLTVVSANYRLAPEHTYPAAIDDCFGAWEWFLESADRLGVDPARIAIAGQSAGGGLAAALCQRIADTGGHQPAAQLLIYPMLDDRTATREDLTAIEHILWNNSNNRYGWSAYLGREAGLEDLAPDWAVPGRRESLAGLPPAWVGVGDKDLFLDEDRVYTQRLREAGVPCEFLVAPLAPHGFDGVAPTAAVSRDFMKSSDAFLKRILGIAE